MPRVKRGVIHLKKRRTILARAKGYRWGRKNQIKKASEAIVKAGVHAYVDRRKKKRTARGLWNIRIGAVSREQGVSYSRLINALKLKKIELDRKVLADLARNNREVMTKVIAEAIKK